MTAAEIVHLLTEFRLHISLAKQTTSFTYKSRATRLIRIIRAAPPAATTGA